MTGIRRRRRIEADRAQASQLAHDPVQYDLIARQAGDRMSWYDRMSAEARAVYQALDFDIDPYFFRMAWQCCSGDAGRVLSMLKSMVAQQRADKATRAYGASHPQARA